MKIGNSKPYLCLYMGFKGDITEGGAGKANQWIFNTFDEIETWDILDPDCEPHVLYCSFSSLKNEEWEPGPE
jgi:hypothetical protein